MRRKALKQKKIWNPALFGIRNPVLGIRNPQGGIQNPGLSWIPLHGATWGLKISNHDTAQDFEKRRAYTLFIEHCQRSKKFSRQLCQPPFTYTQITTKKIGDK